MLKYTKSLLLLLVLLFTITVFIFVVNADLHNIDGIKDTLAGLGNWSSTIFFLLCSIRSFMLLPCGLFSAAGGVLFGPVKGTLLTLAGFTINALIMYFMSNYFGRDWVRRILKDKFVYIDEHVNKNSFSSFLFLRVVPLLPFDAVSCLAGISKAGLSYYLAATVLGSIPGVFVYTYFGDAIKALSYNKVIIPSIFILFMSFVPLIYKLIKHRSLIKKVINKHDKTSI